MQEFSAPSLDNIPTGPRFAVEEGIPKFELKSSLINLVQATQFSGKAHEDASAHLQNFLEIGSRIHINGVDKDVILLRLFPFSLEGKARKWFYTHQDKINFNVGEFKKGIINLLVEQRKEISNQAQQEVLDNFNNLFIVG